MKKTQKSHTRFAIFASALCLCLLANVASAKTYIFVSFSQNDSSLQAYYAEAKRLGATLVMRGLLDDSFVATKAKTEAIEVAYDIDPTLFDKYGIESVPTIVRDEGGKIQKVAGHIPLQSALDIFGVAR